MKVRILADEKDTYSQRVYSTILRQTSHKQGQDSREELQVESKRCVWIGENGISRKIVRRELRKKRNK